MFLFLLPVMSVEIHAVVLLAYLEASQID